MRQASEEAEMVIKDIHPVEIKIEQAFDRR